jgi:steroid 5-alpha reductase family enzyme
MTLFTAEAPFASAAIFTFGLQFAGFVVAYGLQTEKFYDILGSGNFLLLGIWSFFASSSPYAAVSAAATVLFVISRLWLLIFLGWRAHERKGDSRFDEVKNKAGIFLLYWMMQALWVYCISLPIIYINTIFTLEDDVSSTLTPYQVVFLIFFGACIFTEILGDIQKAVWVKKGREGGFCTVGLWKYSRHPNYFGEIFQWWSAFFLILPILFQKHSVYGWACILSPLFTCFILLYAGGTGLTNAEGKGLRRYYENESLADDYKSYRENTSILVPMVGYGSIPKGVKRTLLFEWDRYQYKPKSSESSSEGKKED